MTVDIREDTVQVTRGKAQSQVALGTLRDVRFWQVSLFGLGGAFLRLTGDDGKEITVDVSSVGSTREFRTFVDAASAILATIATAKPDQRVALGSGQTGGVVSHVLIPAAMAVVVVVVQLLMKRQPKLEEYVIGGVIMIFVPIFLWFRYRSMRRDQEFVAADSLAKDLASMR